MKKFLFLLFILCIVLSVQKVYAQDTRSGRHKIAIFAPIYLDSVFDAVNNYRYSSTFPRFVNPGLEFYMGAEMALDSLQRMGAPLEVFIYDSRSQQTPLAQQLNSYELNGVEMIIAHATAPEARLLAETAQKKKIPFISATLPNDAGVTNNPYYVILNSTLRTHVEGIYQYLQQYHIRDNIIVVRKNGVQEDQVRDFLLESNKTSMTTPLKLHFENVGATFNISQLPGKLDSTRRNVIVCGSLDAAFGNNLLSQLAAVATKYSITAIGMPTWEEFNLTKPEFKNLEIVYTTPFNYSRTTSLSSRLANQFLTTTNGRPSDMFYRGYETMLRFAQLLLDTNKDVASNLTRKGNYIFTNFDIQPVFLNRQNMTLDYFENKKLYYVRVSGGLKTAM
ncbi:MAG: amino acid ABC transporter substrate-binding protein [Flavisolibacter sp.]|nr:amino acid ABC transporter substrate-binding protein [Flavisolibacter sp.]